MKYKALILNLVVALLFAIPCIASVVSSAVVPTTRSSGFTVTSPIWNSDVGGIYSYINNNIVPALNKLTAKGDMYVYDGSSLQKQAVGTDGQVITADSTAGNGIKYASFANTTQLTTKGDLLTYGASAQRLGVGTNGQVLTANSALTPGLGWATSTSAIPTGTIIAWSPAGAGTSTIPTGWLLCDGSSGTPNLIGRFVIGSQPTGSVSAPAATGYGSYPVDAAGGGAVNHTHTVNAYTGSTNAASVSVGGQNTGASSFSFGTHVHSFTVPAGTSGATTSEPADYALVYIMKQ
jgi:hypothetical protein